jgi:hypothetical protein
LRDKTRRAIEDLVEMADRLRAYRFDEHIRDLGLGFHMQKQSDGSWSIEFDLPDEKERDATLYTFRLFDQQNEAFSFHSLNRLTRDSDLSDNYRDRIIRIRDAYFTFLQGYPEDVEAGFFEEIQHPTRGEIMRVVMNGGLGHRKDHAKRKRYKIWTRDPVREAVLFQELAKIIHVVLGLIKELLALSKQELSNQDHAA